MRIFHIAGRDEWEAGLRDRRYAPESLRTEGFIHLSTADQWPRVLAARFTGVSDLVLLEVETDRLPEGLRWEAGDGGDEVFPHFYGPLEPAAVISVHTLST